MLEWERCELTFGWPARQRSARVARAPDGSWYVAWRDDQGWSLGHTKSLGDLSKLLARREGLALAGDADLFAEWWASGRGSWTDPHAYCNVQTHEDEDGDWVADSWTCPCGEIGLDYDNFGEAQAAARSHWRAGMRELLGVAE